MPCSKGMLGCKSDCIHRELVRDYHRERIRQEHVADVAAIGYATERAEYLSIHPLITFKQWLIGHRQ